MGVHSELPRSLHVFLTIIGEEKVFGTLPGKSNCVVEDLGIGFHRTDFI